MENLDIFDTDILGRKDVSGNILQLAGKDALRNSLTNWFTSFQGDVIRSPNRAGYLTKHLYKPMNETNRKNIVNAIVDGINQDYYPSVSIETLEVIANYEANAWEINISVYSFLLKDRTDVSVTLKNFV